MNRTDEARAFVLSYLAKNPCPCGVSDVRVLHFHHLNRLEKEFSISKAVSAGYSIDRIKTEIQKCQVLCANCHSIKTREQNAVPQERPLQYREEPEQIEGLILGNFYTVTSGRFKGITAVAVTNFNGDSSPTHCLMSPDFSNDDGIISFWKSFHCLRRATVREELEYRRRFNE